MNSISCSFTFLLLTVIYVPVLCQSDNQEIMDSENQTKSPFHYAHASTNNKFYSLAADLSALGADASVLFFNEKCIIIGKQGTPYILNASVAFNPSSVPLALQDNIYGVESVILSLEMDDENSGKNVSVPEWLKSFGNLKYLTLDHLRLTVNFFEDCNQLKHLIIVGGLKQDTMMLIENISQLNLLEYVVHSNFLTEQEILAIKEKSPRLAIMSEAEYDKKLESGEIKLPE